MNNNRIRDLMDKIAIGPFLLQFNYNSGNKNREKVNGCPKGISL